MVSVLVDFQLLLAALLKLNLSSLESNRLQDQSTPTPQFTELVSLTSFSVTKHSQQCGTKTLKTCQVA